MIDVLKVNAMETHTNRSKHIPAQSLKTNVLNVVAVLQRRDTVDHLGPLLKVCRSEMLRAEEQRRRELQHLYQQDSHVTVSTTLSKLALEAGVQKQRTNDLVYRQRPSPISIPSLLFPGGCRVTR